MKADIYQKVTDQIVSEREGRSALDETLEREYAAGQHHVRCAVTASASVHQCSDAVVGKR